MENVVSSYLLIFAEIISVAAPQFAQISID